MKENVPTYILCIVSKYCKVEYSERVSIVSTCGTNDRGFESLPGAMKEYAHKNIAILLVCDLICII
jgi:hypothetical protein